MEYRTSSEYCSAETAIAVANIKGKYAFDRSSDRLVNISDGRIASIDYNWADDEITNQVLGKHGITDKVIRPLISDVMWWLSKQHHILFEIVTEWDESGYNVIYKYKVTGDWRYIDEITYTGQSFDLYSAMDKACFDACRIIRETND